MSEHPFEMEAMRQWADMVLPTDRDRWPAIINEIRENIEWCCDYIVELEDRLREAAR